MSPIPERVTVDLSAEDIARIQLDRAIELFLGGQDYVSATTLAGAAEVILGDLLKRSGKSHALDEIVENSLRISAHLYPDEPADRKGVVSLANYFRDRLKHLGKGDTFRVSIDYEAAWMIDRAADNYERLCGDSTEAIDRFREFAYFGAPSTPA